jgi:mannose-6-phosphate isomerase-like protein (cupin superfamily)
MNERGSEIPPKVSKATRPPGEAPAGKTRVTVAEGRATRILPGKLAAPVLAHGSLLVEYYAPRGQDRQTPHTRDEVYVVIRGTGLFVNGAERHPFGPGDVLFVPAGVAHRFEDFTDDFAVWVVFYGPEGGERARA